MRYRLCLDLGSTSLGWAALEIDTDNQPVSLIDMGVRIYDDGRIAKTEEPLAVTRRLARGARRNRDRRIRRKLKLMSALIECGLFPKDREEQKLLEKLDPYELRAKAINEMLSPYEIGRALLHINQRRGFKSNRKSDKNSNEAGPVKLAIAKLEQEMMANGSRTLGEYLYKMETKRVRYNGKEYSLYPMRKMYEDEVSLLFSKQKEYHADILTDDVCSKITDIIFHQRELHKPKIGWCTFEYKNEQPRAPLALPSVQNFRIWQEVNNLDCVDYTTTDICLDKEDRAKIAELLNRPTNKNATITFKAIRKALDIDSSFKFNLEDDKRSTLKGNETSAKLSHSDAFGKKWFDFPLEEQDRIVIKLLEEENEKDLINWLLDHYELSLEQAEFISNISLPDGYGRLSLAAITKILPHLMDGCGYSEACQKAGYHHSDFRTGEIILPLPYYGEVLQHRVIGGSNNENDMPEDRYGKVNNPTVHIVLNQVRKLVNAAIDRWGEPAQISLELARDLKQPKREIEKEQAKNKKDNERIAKDLEKINVKNNYANRMKYKIWEDLCPEPQQRCCPFTGTTISLEDLYSPIFEVEHLIPFSLCFDDSRANKVISLKSANRDKGNKTPYDAFGHSPGNYDWKKIQAKADLLPRSKRWRFQPDALEKVTNDKHGAIARQLNDTRYLSRLAKEYLQYVCGLDNIITVPGQMTAFMRRHWGLEDIWENGTKDRSDHRHHAIDAFVVGCTTRAMLQKISGAAKNIEEKAELREKRHKLVTDMPIPFEGYLKQIEDKFNTMIISHKPDHGNAAKAIKSPRPYTTAQLHEESAYGYVGKGNKKETSLYVIRKPIDGMRKRKDIEAIRDDKIRQYLLNATAGQKDNSKEFTDALYNAAQTWSTPIKRVRVLVQKTDNVMIGIKDKTSNKPYKFYQGGGNAYTEIYMATKGKDAGKWKAETISQYNAHKPHGGRKWRQEDPTAKFIMRLHNNDMVAYDENGQTAIARVKKMTGGRVYLRDHHIAQEEADTLSWAASSAQMQKKNLRKIYVDILGRVKDPKHSPSTKSKAAA